LSKRSVAGTYEIEVMLGSQEVCILELDLPETKNELRSLKLDSPTGQEFFRGLVAGIFSERGQQEYTRQLQVYDLLESISTIRELFESGEQSEKIKSKLNSLAKDEVTQSCLNFFLNLLEGQLSNDKMLQMLSGFSKFLLTKKESLPKVSSQPKSSTPRWDRVAKQTVLITDEPTQEIEVNPLEDGILDEADTTDTDWHDPAGDVEGEIEPDTDDISEPDDIP
jgi:hypothetical protein